MSEDRRRLLLVVGAYAPAMMADMQRARMLAWELPRLGWDVEILSPLAKEVRADVLEPDAAGFFAPDVPLHEVGSIGRKAFRAMGSRTHGWPTLLPMLWRGHRLLSSRRFDLIYFSTTTFVYFCLGPLWQRRFGTPFVVDFHDPWAREAEQTAASQPWRSRLAQGVASNMERAVVTHARGLISVSPRYLTDLHDRYRAARLPWQAAGRHAVIPIGALEKDMSAVRSKSSLSGHAEKSLLNVSYVGAGGRLMVRSFTQICRALAALREQGCELIARLRIRLFGTDPDWSPGAQKILEAIAVAAGLDDLVEECPQRISYRRSLELLAESRGTLILGIDDVGYMPSKLFSYALSGKPVLASVRRDGPAYAQLRRCSAGMHSLWFDEAGEMAASEAAAVADRFIAEVAAKSLVNRRDAIAPFLAPAMAERHAELFAACLSGR
jgi:hypothetical protein